MKIQDKLLIVALACFLIANPLTGQYILQGINILFDLIFIYGFYISIVGAVYLTIYFAITIYTVDRVKIPSKNNKKKSKFIDVK